MEPNPVLELTSARLAAINLAPYYAAAIWKMVPVRRPGLGTFGVDAHWRLYYDPETLQEWGPQQAGGVLAHEVGHLIRGHHARAQAMGRVDRKLWNYVGDAAINDDLILAGFPLPVDVVTPKGMGLTPGGIEEDYYRQLAEHAEHARPEQGQGTGGTGGAPDDDDPDDAGCGSGAGGPAEPWELPANDPNTPSVSAASAEMTRRRVAEAVREHASRNPGSTPAGLSRWAEQALTPARVDWRAHLRARLRRAVAWRAGQQDYTYSRASRRQMPGIILPGHREPVVHTSVVIDTSGSMSADNLQAALSEVVGITQAGRNRRLTVVTCDASAHVQQVSNPEQVVLTGGGGTDMRIGIEAALTAKTRPDVIVVLTDGFTPWPSNPLPVPLVIGLIGPMAGVPAPNTGAPSWASVVPID